MTESKEQSPRWISGVEPPRELLVATGTEILAFECREQPARLRELIRAYRKNSGIQDTLSAVRELAGERTGPILFIGMGASFCSSVSGSALLQSNGRLSFAVDAGEWLHYASPVWGDAALSVLVTTSGESAELVALLKKSGELPLALVSNNSSSTCWSLAKNKLPILAGPEYGNATKTYTNATAASIILSSEILQRPWEHEAEHVADVFERNLERVFALRAELEEFCRGAANTEIIGRGAAYGAAVMSALCIREMTGHRAAAHTGAGFRHGPNLDVDSSHVAIIFALGRVPELGVKLASECNKCGGRVVLVSTEQHTPNERLFPVRIDPVPEPWEAITALSVPQALTLAMVERNGCRLPPRFQYGVMEQ